MQGQAENAKEANLEKKEHGTAENTSLVEIGPRFVLNPIRIFRGSFGGQTLYQNPDYVSPNEIRAKNLRAKGNTYFGRKQAQNKRKTRKENVVLPEDPLAHVFN
uniref:Brix domain-containing protein n=2 Tax=Eucampia antarctica TaxID=49252 RepID=A0A7S2W5Y0_9STRA|mmetsp:Transcript_21005/g.20190  ORF Transcript_21005/g.20190 Transcript_21005/m.20190 type:complete len:104 (+) Transcript_21005:123-434(+)